MTNKEITAANITPEAARAEIEFLLHAGANFQMEIDMRSEPKVFQALGETYCTYGGSFKKLDPPRPERIVKGEPFKTFSLDGLIEFIKKDVDNVFNNPEFSYIVRVTSPTLVEVMSQINGYWKEREVVARCEATVPTIRFGEYMDPETFQIMLQTSFEDSENRAKVLLLSGNLRKEQEITTADDGVSQRVTVNAGVASAAGVTVKNPVELTPYRTFREIEQPQSPFVLRFDEGAKAALFTGDEKSWQLEAVSRIADYLCAQLVEYNVVVIA